MKCWLAKLVKQYEDKLECNRFYLKARPAFLRFINNITEIEEPKLKRQCIKRLYEERATG